MEDLRTNWVNAVNKPLNAYPQDIRIFVESTQFYFSGRTNYENLDLKTLLNGPWPIRFSGTNFSEADFQRFESISLLMRIDWFKLLLQLHPKLVFATNSGAMTAISRLLQNLDEMEKDNLNKQVTPAEFQTIRSAMDSFPEFSKDDLKELAAKDDKVSYGYDPSAEKRFRNYSSLVAQLNQAKLGLYNHFWTENPVVFESRINSLWVWVNNDLDFFNEVLKAANHAKVDSNRAVILNIHAWLTSCLQDIDNANIPHNQHNDIIEAPKMGKEDLDLVQDFNQHFYFKGQQFDVDYVSKCTNVIAAIYSGSLQDAVEAIKLNHGDENLDLPIKELTDFARRTNNDKFKSDLEQLHSRLEGLQYLAQRISIRQ